MGEAIGEGLRRVRLGVGVKSRSFGGWGTKGRGLELGVGLRVWEEHTCSNASLPPSGSDE